MKTYLYLVVLIFISCSYKAKVLKVEDGDSFYIKGREIRIWGLDAPEYSRGHNQPFGDIAKEFTRKLIEGKTVKLIVEDHDKYGREVDKVILSNGDDLSLLIINAGLCFVYQKYSTKEYYNA